jgi:hypothetical protein
LEWAKWPSHSEAGAASDWAGGRCGQVSLEQDVVLAIKGSTYEFCVKILKKSKDFSGERSDITLYSPQSNGHRPDSISSILARRLRAASGIE